MLLLPSENRCPIKLSSSNLMFMNTMKSSDGGNTLFHHPFFSLDPSINPDLVLMIKTKENNNNSVVETTRKTNSDNNVPPPCYRNEVMHSESSMTSIKSKVPDILMINKYYGLIPQKFTISSRKAANSTPGSAGSSARHVAARSNTANKPRAKSSTYHHPHPNRQERKYGQGSKGSRSDNDSPEPIIKTILTPKQRSPGGSGYESPNEKSSDPFGPVTKKMSVERYKKWKNGGGGKGRNVRSSSDIGQTLSLLDNRLPGVGFTSHARNNNNRASTAAAAAPEFTANRRVIKIDLNRVSSWDEENYRIPMCSLDSTATDENKEPKTKVVVDPPSSPESESEMFRAESRNTSTASNINYSSFNSSCDYSFSSTHYVSRSSSQGKSSPIDTSHLDNNGSYIGFVNNDNDCDSVATNAGSDEQTTYATTSSNTSMEANESGSHNLTTLKDSSMLESRPTSVSTSFRRESQLSDDGIQVQEELSPERDDENDNKRELKDKHYLNNSLDGSSESLIKIGHDKKVASMQRSGKLSSRTISFDDRMLNESPEARMTSGRVDSSSARRPTTASARFHSRSVSTPNGFNPPSRVVPWTQQKTAGGKALTLAERRAKFQRAPSIHSSSSLSMETGEEETLSEVESSKGIRCVPPPSSAFRESRKPLHVTQPPEIPTMISQNHPNADEDIQIEIEKVAIMLRKMQSMKHFSMSLDSGIEAEMARTASAPDDEGTTASLMPTNNQSGSTDSMTVLPETLQILNSSGSESSVSSMESPSSDEEDSPDKTESKSCPSSSRAKLRACGGGGKSQNHKEKIGFSSDNPQKRHSVFNRNNSCISNLSSNNNNNNNSNTKKPSSASSSILSLNNNSPSTAGIITDTSTSTPSAHRPPLRKAVSISCEQELLKTGGDHKRNEVNFNSNDKGKCLRPKTAAGPSSPYQRHNVSGTRSIHNNNYQYRQNSLSSCESHQATSTSVSNGSQGSRNRKILIKKALMEINQSSVNTRKKWGNVGRPRTAPSNNASHHGVIGPQQLLQQHSRKPLKASPFAISSNGKSGSSSIGKSALTGGSNTVSELTVGEKVMEKSGPAGHIQRSSSEARIEDSDGKSLPSQQKPDGENSSKGRTAFRQCFSLDESALLGFSIKSVNGRSIPIYDKLASEESTESCPISIMDDEISFLSSKKREQCLKVYEKMTNTGCTIKLETIFRGMLTPSEYRAFMRAAEKANNVETTEELASGENFDEDLPEAVNNSHGKEGIAE